MLLFFVDKLGFIGELALALRDCFVHLFKGGARAALAQKRHFLFAKLFLLGLLPQKKKRLTNLDSKKV